MVRWYVHMCIQTLDTNMQEWHTLAFEEKKYTIFSLYCMCMQQMSTLYTGVEYGCTQVE
jgi:hypothetical protein